MAKKLKKSVIYDAVANRFRNAKTGKFVTAKQAHTR